MSLAKALLFSRKLKGVTVEYSGKTPLDAVAQEAALKAAYEKGYQTAAEKFNAQILQMRQEMQQHAEGVLKGMERAYEVMTKDLAEALPEVVVGSVYRLMGEKAMEAPTLKARVEHLIAESCPTQEPVEVYLSSEDFSRLREIDEKFITEHPRLSFRSDESLKSGDCRMISKFGEVDATIKTQLRRLWDEMAAT